MRYQITGNDGTLTAFLEGVCKTLTEAPNNERQNVPGHVLHPPFQCVFSESDEPQAKAMLMDGVSIICIMKGMLGLVWTACDLLSKSQHVTLNQACGLLLRNARPRILPTLFYLWDSET